MILAVAIIIFRISKKLASPLTKAQRSQNLAETTKHVSKADLRRLSKQQALFDRYCNFSIIPAGHLLNGAVKYFECEAKLLGREHVRGSHVGASVSLGHGLRVYESFERRGYDITSVKDSGLLVFSDKKLFFTSAHHNITVPYGKILEIRNHRHGFDIVRENTEVLIFVTKKDVAGVILSRIINGQLASMNLMATLES